MEIAVISGESKKDIQLLIAIAEKMGIKAKFLTRDELEDIGLAKAMDEGKTGEFIDTDDFLKSLR